MIPTTVCLLIFLGFALPAYTGRNFGAVVVLLSMYGVSITPVMYCASWFFKVPSTAYGELQRAIRDPLLIWPLFSCVDLYKLVHWNHMHHDDIYSRAVSGR